MHGSEQNQLPTLPNDLMFLIFNELSTEERISLGTTCKRFREIDFDLGKKFFDKIRIIQRDDNKVKVEVGEKVDYFVLENNNAYQNMRLFRNARTKFLNILIDVDETPAQDFQNIYEFCMKIPFKRLTITSINFASIEQFAELVKSQRFKRAEVFFKIFNCSIFSDTIRYDTFHSILMNTTHAELSKVSCTASELQNAFEIFRLTDSYKYVAFDISQQTVDEFINSMMYLPSVEYDWEEDEEDGELAYVFDESSRTILFASNNDNDESFARVAIGKIDEQDTFVMSNDVRWF